MEKEETPKSERTIYAIFRVAVFLKGAQGILDLILGILVFLVPLRFIGMLADHLFEGQLRRDPDDFIATHLTAFAHNVSIGGKNFAVIYLLLHGVIKLALAVALLSGKRWAYPFALWVLGVLVTYQIYRILLHHSLLLMGATLLDIGLFYFIYHEYRVLEQRDGKGTPAS